MGDASPVLRLLGPEESLPSDEALTAASLTGNMRALEELYRRYHTPVVCYLQRLCRDEDIAEDLFQEAFFRAYANLERFDARRRFRPWLYRIANNVGLDWLRSRSRALPPVEGPLTERSAAEVVAERELGRQVAEAVSHLSDDHRTVFILRQYQGLSYAEIADICDCPEGTVRSRMHYALRILRAKLRFLLEESD